MVEKYGVYAADLLKAAITTPRYLNEDLGHAMQSSVKTVDYLLSNDVDMAKVAKALKISEEELASKANVAAREQNVAEGTSGRTETKAAIKQQRLEADKREKDLIVSTKTGLLTACWDVFGSRRGNGANLSMHMDPKGYPTIGAGHLVMLNPPDAKYRARHIEKMTKIGIPKEQAAREFDAVAAAMRNGTIRTQKKNGVNVIVSPKLTPLTDEQAKKLFMLDAERCYQDAAKNFPDLHKYPIELQTLIVHNAYHFGSTNNLKRACGGDLSAENVAQQAANLRVKSGHCSINTACEIDAAFKSLDMTAPSAILAKINKYRHSANSYEKNIAQVVRGKDYNMC